LKELERGRGRGIPRTLTLPAHLTESLMKMKITRERDGSAELMPVHPETMEQESIGKVEKYGMDVDGMEVDGTVKRKSKSKLSVQTQSTESTIQQDQKTPPRSPRKGKGKRRRARSAPPRQRVNPDADACDGHDEDGGTTEGDENNTGPFSSAETTRSTRPISTVGKIRSPAEKTSKILGWHNTLFFENSTSISSANEMKY
jgi:hypothetical protein